VNAFLVETQSLLDYADVYLLCHRGGFGEVWRCKLGETTVAVKKLLSHWLEADSTTAEEFRCEAEILKKLRHPNIVMFFGAGL